VKHDYLGVRSAEVMPPDFRADVAWNDDAPLLAGHVVDPLDVSGVPVSASIADDEMFFRQAVGEVEAAAQKMLPGDRIAEGGALFCGGSLDGDPDLPHFGVVHLSEIDRILLQTGQDNGLDEFEIGGHHGMFIEDIAFLFLIHDGMNKADAASSGFAI